MRRIFPSSTSILVSLGVTAAVIALLAIMRWLGLPAGELRDWLVAVAGFWWLLGVVTVPWNLHFAARAASAELDTSSAREIEVAPADRRYVVRTARWTLAAAVALHAVTAAGFAAIAAFGWSSVGWVGAGAALALTSARPLVALYGHVAMRLAHIDRRARYPREDVRTLEVRLADVVRELDLLRRACDPDERGSWAHRVDAALAELERRADTLTRAQAAEREANAQAHDVLERQIDSTARRLGEDSQFLGNVRDIIRFLKEA